MPDTPKPLTFNLPDQKRIEIFLVKLANGTTVARTAAELAPAPKVTK